MQFKTNISVTKNGRHFVRGHDVVELINEHTLVETIFLLWRGSWPRLEEVKLLEAMLVAAVENGLEAPSLYVPRVSASAGNNMHTALAAGILAIGERHGGAVEAAAMMLSQPKSAADMVAEFMRDKKYLPGFGHKIYKDEDPRATALQTKAAQCGLVGKFFTLAKEIETKVELTKGKKIPLNIDGALAAGMLELHFDPRLGKALFILPRLIGMAAHVLEEYQQGNSYYRLEANEIKHD